MQDIKISDECIGLILGLGFVILYIQSNLFVGGGGVCLFNIFYHQNMRLG